LDDAVGRAIIKSGFQFIVDWFFFLDPASFNQFPVLIFNPVENRTQPVLGLFVVKESYVLAPDSGP
jgi:hypothetical protein